MNETTVSTENKNHLDIARWGAVLIGNRQNVLKTLEAEFPFASADAQATKTSKYYHGTLSFSEQIEKVMTYSRNKGLAYVPAVLQYQQYTPEAEMTDELRAVPEKWRELRFVRVEIHR